MSGFKDREKGQEAKFAHDAELRFKAEARCNKLLGEWAAARLGLSGAEVDEYVKAVRKSDLAQKGDDDVFQKVSKDFADKGVNVAPAELRKMMGEFLAQAVSQIESQSKG